jgi:hypothetical protein
MAPWNHFRAHDRFRVQLAATMTVASRGLEAQGRIQDLGLGGASLEVAQPLRLGEPVQIRVWVPGALLQAEVAWVAWAASGSARAGVRFRPESVEDVRELLSLVVRTVETG